MFLNKMSEEVKKPFSIKSWNAVASWKWDTDTNECSICRNNIMDNCTECVSSENYAEMENCKAVKGNGVNCDHSFHHHCISKWLENHDNCPLHSDKWKY